MLRNVKKRLCLHRGYLRFSFESSAHELSSDVVHACHILNEGAFIFGIFSNDDLNNSVFSNARKLFRYRSLNYYLIEDIGILHSINLANMRHVSIYATDQQNLDGIDYKCLINTSPFCMSFENYLETSELLVRKESYKSDFLTALK